MRDKIVATFDYEYDENGAKVMQLMKSFMGEDGVKLVPLEADAQYLAPAVQDSANTGAPWEHTATYGKFNLRALKTCVNNFASNDSSSAVWTPMRGRGECDRKQLEHYQIHTHAGGRGSLSAPGGAGAPTGPPRPFEYPTLGDVRTVSELREALVDTVFKQIELRAKSIVTLQVLPSSHSLCPPDLKGVC